MKLKLRPMLYPEGAPPPRSDVAMLVFADSVIGEHRISVRCPDAEKTAKYIMHAVNYYPSLVAALTPFSSDHMGRLLIDVVLNDAPAGVSDETMNLVHGRLSKLVNAIDLILKGVELNTETDNNESGRETQASQATEDK